MGGGSIKSEDMRSYYTKSTHISSATSASQVFRSSYMPKDFDPSKIKLPREAMDSSLSPKSRGIILSEDVTGSMGYYLLDLIKERFPELIEKIYETVSYNPHIMFMGIGDVVYDKAPLQVTQFETDLRILDQLQKIWLEKGGGGNSFESYILTWYFAAKHTYMDCWEKRREKGFIFTFGDEEPTPYITKSEINKVFGENDYPQQARYTGKECLDMASEKFNCYHIILHGNGYDSTVVRMWKELMGGHVCDLKDHIYIPDLITTILKMYEGKSKTDAISEITDTNARRAVSEALFNHEENVAVDQVSNSSNAGIEVF